MKDPGTGIAVNGKNGIQPSLQTHVMDKNGGSAHHGCFELEVLEVEHSLISSTPCMMTSILEKFRQTRELECGSERTW
jgi:hypothetical protein